ncbi:MAG: RHS repeat-associated core domain-containing protein, partial [Acidobacteriota bacterium]
APFGEDMTTAGNQDYFGLRFTGHERDYHNVGVLDDLDYMHARHYTPYVGRFLQVDQVLGTPASPQSWNRYAYANNDPVNFFDPDGRSGIPAGLRNALQNELATVWLPAAKAAAWDFANSLSVSLSFTGGYKKWGASAGCSFGLSSGSCSFAGGRGYGLGGSLSLDYTAGKTPSASPFFSITGGHVGGGHATITRSSLTGGAGFGFGLGVAYGGQKTRCLYGCSGASGSADDLPQWYQVSCENDDGEEQCEHKWKRFGGSDAGGGGGLPGLPDPLVYTDDQRRAIESFERWLVGSRSFWESIGQGHIYGPASLGGGNGAFCDAACDTPYY